MNNIKKYRQMRGMKQTDLCKLLDVSQSSLSGWENGKFEPDIATLKKLADIFGTTIDSILGTKSEPRLLASDRKGIKIPVVGSSAAGFPIDAIMEYIDENDPDTWEEISESMAATGEYVAVRIKGDSMEPRIMDGDIIIVRLQDSIDTGDTAIVFIEENEATCKKIKKRPDGILLISGNPKYEPMFFSNEEIASLPLRIYGKVVEVRGKL